MKRFLIAIIIIVALFSSCKADATTSLEYQKYPMTVSGTLLQDNFSCAINVTMFSENTATLTVSSPKTLTGYSFKLENERVRAFYEDMEIELCASSELPIERLAEMLSLSPEDYKYSRTQEGQSCAFFDDGVYETVIFTQKDETVPNRIEQTKEEDTLVFEIDSLIVQ